MRITKLELLVIHILSIGLLIPTPARGAVVYFLAAGRFCDCQAIVLPISDPDHIAHARRHVADPTLEDRPIPAVTLERGDDGINRDYATAAKRPWGWHVTAVLGFGDHATDDASTTSPAQVLNHPEFWFDTYARWGVAFAGLKIVKELGSDPPLWLAYERTANNLRFTWANLGGDFRYILESAPFPNGHWQPVPGNDWPTSSTTLDVPLTQTSGFFRVRAQAGP